jgi:hypothetical protein
MYREREIEPEKKGGYREGDIRWKIHGGVDRGETQGSGEEMERGRREGGTAGERQRRGRGENRGGDPCRADQRQRWRPMQGGPETEVETHAGRTRD